MYQGNLTAAGFGRIATEIAFAGPFFFAGDDHQEHLDTNPNGYGPDYNTGVACPTGIPVVTLWRTDGAPRHHLAARRARGAGGPASRL